MDLSRFSDEDFDVKAWVNGALALSTHKDKQTSVDVGQGSVSQN